MIPRVTIRRLSDGLGHGYGIETKRGWHCFAYTWTSRVGSKEWWMALYFAADIDSVHPPRRKKRGR